MSDQIVDMILTKHPEFYKYYISTQASLALPIIYDQSTSTENARTAAIGKFLSFWIIIERTFYIYCKNKGLKPGFGFSKTADLARRMELSSKSFNSIVRVRITRNQLVHGIEVPNIAYLEEATSELRDITEEIAAHSDSDVRAAYEEARQPLDV